MLTTTEFEEVKGKTVLLDKLNEKKIKELGCEIVQLPSRRKSPIVYFFSLAHFIFSQSIPFS